MVRIWCAGLKGDDMIRRTAAAFGLLLGVAAVAGCGGGGAGVQPIPGSPASLEHFVFIMKENRTFDHYFGKFPGADGATQGMIHTGQILPLTPAPDFQPHDIDHSEGGEKTAIDGGKMDGFDLIGAGEDLVVLHTVRRIRDPKLLGLRPSLYAG